MDNRHTEAGSGMAYDILNDEIYNFAEEEAKFDYSKEKRLVLLQEVAEKYDWFELIDGTLWSFYKEDPNNKMWQVSEWDVNSAGRVEGLIGGLQSVSFDRKHIIVVGPGYASICTGSPNNDPYEMSIEERTIFAKELPWRAKWVKEMWTLDGRKLPPLPEIE